MFKRSKFFLIAKASSFLLIAGVGLFAQIVSFYPTSEEFVGPFPSWKNVVTDYGANGSDANDDAPAIQNALNALRTSSTNTWCVLYFPAGTYRINSSLSTTRTDVNSDYHGFSIIGEDPANTVILWNGTANQNMLNLDGWFCKVSRLTFNGNSSANYGIMRDGSFSTFCELSDLFFLDMKTGISLGGGRGTDGQAEHQITRCRFTRCTEQGIATNNWNTLDIWIWYCSFKDCARGVLNLCGGYHCYNNVFVGSTVGDIMNNNLGGFAWVNNVSIGSAIFAQCASGSWPFIALIQGNRIYGCTGDGAIRLSSLGPQIVVDNIIKGTSATDTKKAIQAWAGSQMLVGNTFTNANPVSVSTASGTRCRQLDQHQVVYSSLATPDTVYLPATPPKVTRTIYEVTTAATIQSQIVAAAGQPFGSRPVVHIPKGTYTVTSTIVIPKRKDVQIIGDGGAGFGTTIVGTMKFLGPSKATLKDLNLQGSGEPVLKLENCDQVGARVYARQVNISGAGGATSQMIKRCIEVDRVENADVTFTCINLMNSYAGISVRGGRTLKSGGNTAGQVAMITGSSSHATSILDVTDNGRLIAHAFWYEGSWANPTPYLDLTPASSGKLTAAGMPWSVANTTDPLISVDGFKGVLTLASNMFSSDNGLPHWIRIKGDGSNCKVLSECNTTKIGPTLFPSTAYLKDSTSPACQSAIELSTQWGNVNGNINNYTNKVDNVTPDSQFVLECLSQLRGLRFPDLRPISDTNITDFKLLRCSISPAGGKTGIVVQGDTATAVRSSMFIPSNQKGVFIQKVIMSTTNGFHIPKNATGISIYDLKGKLLLNESLDRSNVLFTKQLDRIQLRQAVVVKYYY